MEPLHDKRFTLLQASGVLCCHLPQPKAESNQTEALPEEHQLQDDSIVLSAETWASTIAPGEYHAVDKQTVEEQAMAR